MNEQEEAETPNTGGRPEFEPTPDQRDRVECAIAMGMSIDDAARAVGISAMTLRKHFNEELLNGRAKKRLENIMLMFASARNGNASIQKTIEDKISMLVSPMRPQTEPKPEWVGKKEEAELAAQEPPPEGSRWQGLLN